MTRALIDADILCYRIGFSTEDEHENLALVRMDNYIQEIMDGSTCSEYEMFLTGPTNFRKDIYPAYKANRKNVAKPKHLQRLRKHLIEIEGAVVSEGEEADDLLGINQTDETIICSIDKDLLMIEGRHYNFVKKQHSEVSKLEGRHNFYMQLLTGDSTDNIPGIYGCGPAKASIILTGATELEDYNQRILGAYKEFYSYCCEEDVRKHINLIGKLLWIRTEPKQMWRFDG